jgi:polysaccharide export outer membrane protein
MLFFFLPAAVHGDDYLIGEGDTLKISVWQNEEMSLSVKVRPDGKITVPALGEILAAGRTPKELQKELTKNLKTLIKRPIVSVIVEEINNNKVYVFGGGIEPGVFSLIGRTTLLQLLCTIPGIDDSDLQRAYLLRKGKKIKQDFFALCIQGDTKEDLLVKANDIIFVPAYEDNKIYVLGAVNEPKFIEYREGLRIMEAILEAGGFTKFAKENNTQVYRKVGEEEISTKVNLQNLIKDGDLTRNIKLQPGDYIIVDESIF